MTQRRSLAIVGLFSILPLQGNQRDETPEQTILAWLIQPNNCCKPTQLNHLQQSPSKKVEFSSVGGLFKYCTGWILWSSYTSTNTWWHSCIFRGGKRKGKLIRNKIMQERHSTSIPAKLHTNCPMHPYREGTNHCVDGGDTRRHKRKATILWTASLHAFTFP